MGATEDRLFERWCRQGDAEALGELFDLASPGLLRLAIHLVGEPAEAEDLVQATFLAAIEQRASVDSSRPVLPWLTAVLSKKAADHKRRSSRSLDVEHLLQSAEGDASHSAEQRELSGELAKAIDALEEPYRQVMILRLRHGLSPADIAHVLERSPGAVRVQLHRAQQKLRGRLPSTLVGAFLIGAAAPRGLAAVRTNVMTKALSVAPAVSAAATTATVLGGLVMGKKIAVAVVAGLLATGVWWLARSESAPRSATASPQSTPSNKLASVEEDIRSSNPALDEQRLSVVGAEQTSTPDSNASLDIEVVWWDGSPAAGVGLEQFGTEGQSNRSTRLLSDDSGRIHIASIPSGPRGFLLDRWTQDSPEFGRTITAEIRPGITNRLRIEAPRGSDVSGSVLDARGNAVASAELWGSWSNWASPNLLGRAAQDGSFLLRSLPAQEYYLYAKAEHHGISKAVAVSELSVGANGILAAELRLSATTAELFGKVVGTKGEPIADADVILTLQAQTSVARRCLRERTQADGAFRFSGLCRSMIALEVGAADYPLWRTRLDLEDGESRQLDIQLQEGVTLVGTLRIADGRTSGAFVEWAGNSLLTYPGDLAWKHIDRAHADASGQYRLTGLPPGEIRLRAETTGAPLARTSTTLQGAAGETVRWDVLLAAPDGRIVGRAVDPSGNPLSGWWVDALPSGGQGHPQPSGRTDADGRFVLEGCAEVEHLVRLCWPGKEGRVGRSPIVEKDFVKPNGEDLLFIVTPEMVPTASLSVTLLDSEGLPAKGLHVSAMDERGESRGHVTPGENGRYLIEFLPAARYALVCNSEDLAAEVLGSFELKPEEDLEAGTLQLSRRGSLEVTLRRTDGATLSGPQTRVVGADGRFVSLANETTEDGTVYRSPALVPGRYVVVPTFSNAAGPMREVWIRAGETTSLAIDLEPGARFVLDFHVPARSRPPSVLSLALRDKGGAMVLATECRYFSRYRDGRWIHRFVGSLPVGEYSYDASSPEGLVASGEFEIGGSDKLSGFDVELTQKP